MFLVIYYDICRYMSLDAISVIWHLCRFLYYEKEEKYKFESLKYLLIVFDFKMHGFKKN